MMLDKVGGLGNSLEILIYHSLGSIGLRAEGRVNPLETVMSKHHSGEYLLWLSVLARG